MKYREKFLVTKMTENYEELLELDGELLLNESIFDNCEEHYLLSQDNENFIQTDEQNDKTDASHSQAPPDSSFELNAFSDTDANAS